MYVLSESDVKKALGLQDCLEVNRKALVSVSDQSAFVPSRLGLPFPHNPRRPQPPSSTTTGKANAKDWTLVKPAAHYDPNTSLKISMGLKVVSIRAQNPANGLPLVPATILVLDAVSGMVEATIAGTYVTVARTSAGPALAVEAFRPDVEHLVLFGAGAQAKCHLEIVEVALGRSLPKITIVNRTFATAERLKNSFLAQRTKSNENSSTPDISVVVLEDTDGVNQALATADVVCTTTNATEPLWQDGSILPKGCLITGIGSYTPQMQEVPPSAVDRCHVVIDTPETLSVGDLKHLQATTEDIQSSDALTSTTDSGSSRLVSKVPITLAGDAFRRPSTIGKSTDCIFYKAVGTAIQDVLTAEMVIARAKRFGIGKEIDMT